MNYNLVLELYYIDSNETTSYPSSSHFSAFNKVLEIMFSI